MSRYSLRDYRFRIGSIIFLSVLVGNTIHKFVDHITIQAFTDPVTTAVLYIVALNVMFYPQLRFTKKSLIPEAFLIVIGITIAYLMWVA